MHHPDLCPEPNRKCRGISVQPEQCVDSLCRAGACAVFKQCYACSLAAALLQSGFVNVKREERQKRFCQCCKSPGPRKISLARMRPPSILETSPTSCCFSGVALVPRLALISHQLHASLQAKPERMRWTGLCSGSVEPRWLKVLTSLIALVQGRLSTMTKNMM